MIILNNILNYKNYLISINKTISIMFWIKMSDKRLNREFLCGNDPFNDLGIILETSISNQISFYCGDGSRIDNKHCKYYAYTGRLPYNQFSHICFVRNDSQIFVYVNSKLVRNYKIGNINLINKQFIVGKSKYYYLEDLSQSVKFFKLFNESISISKIKELVNYNNFTYYYEDKISKLFYIYNTTVINYNFKKDSKSYIYNFHLFLEYENSKYNEIVKLNNYSLSNLESLIDNDTTLEFDLNLLVNDNIHNIIKNIISWQFGMYQDLYPKILKTSTIGFWSKRVCNFFVPYTGQEIKYNYGSLQDGTGCFIKLIIDYYIKYKNSNSSLISDCLNSVNIFIDYLNEMIYENGGIPQYYPLQGYHFDNICLNDGAIITYLFCCDHILKSDIKKEINENKIKLLKQNYDKAIKCILNLQIVINNEKTIWAQQYNPSTLEPTSARSFELASLCSLESAQLLIYLMSLADPSNEIKESINTGCTWFLNNSIKGYSQEIIDDLIVIRNQENNSRNLYSRYYSLDNQSPLFYDRDGKVYNLETFNELPVERRNGYTWLGCWGEHLLEIYNYWKIFNL